MKPNNEVLSVKVKPAIKELVAVGSNYANTSMGDFVAKGLLNYAKRVGYPEFLIENLKKNGFELVSVLHETARLEGEKFQNNMSAVLEEFYEEVLYLEEAFEEINVGELSLELLEQLDYSVEFEEYVRSRLKDAILSRIDNEVKAILGISSALLFLIFADLERTLDLEVSVQIRLFSTSYPISVAKDLELLVRVSSEFTSCRFEHWQLQEFLKSLNKDQELWYYTFIEVMLREFRGKVVLPAEAKQFFDKIFLEPEFHIFTLVKLENMIQKIIETPKVDPFSMNFKLV